MGALKRLRGAFLPVLVALLLGAVTLGWQYRKQTQALGVQVQELQQALDTQAEVSKLRARVAASQAEYRVQHRVNTQVVREVILKEREAEDAENADCVLSGADVERLRKYTESINSGIRAASELP